MRYTICSRCHAVITYGKFGCPSCGTLLGPEKIERVKLCRRDGTPVPVGGRFCSTCGGHVWGVAIRWWYWSVPVVVASIVVTILLANLHHDVYITYKSLSCVIDDTSVTSSSTKSGTTYSPDFTYEVRGTDGQQIASGDGGMGLAGGYSSSDDAQQVANQYQIGSSYPCWYSPIATPSAMLRQPDEGASGAGESIVWLLGTGGLLALILWCVVKLDLHPIQLYKRGVAAVSIVKDYEYHTDKNGHKHTISIVEFQTATEPALTCRMKIHRKEGLGKRINVFYDRLNPTRNVKALTHFDGVDAFTTMLCGFLLLILMMGLGSWLLVYLAFIF